MRKLRRAGASTVKFGELVKPAPSLFARAMASAHAEIRLAAAIAKCNLWLRECVSGKYWHSSWRPAPSARKMKLSPSAKSSSAENKCSENAEAQLEVAKNRHLSVMPLLCGRKCPVTRMASISWRRCIIVGMARPNARRRANARIMSPSGRNSSFGDHHDRWRIFRPGVGKYKIAAWRGFTRLTKAVCLWSGIRNPNGIV